MSARVFETCHAALERLPAHRHALAYVALVISGSYEEVGPDGAWTCEPGDLVVHPPFHIHGDRFAADDVRVLNVEVSLRDSRQVGWTAYRVVHTDEPGCLARIDRRRNCLDAWSELIAGAKPTRRAGPGTWLDALAQSLAADATASIGALARAAGKTPEHAARAFLARFGIGPARFRAENGFRQVLQRLASQDAPLSAIAAEAGYADQSHMTRAVSRVTGMTPSGLRQAFH